jgi:hypothetical protein
VEPSSASASASRTLTDRFPFLRADSPVPTYLGILLAVAGFGLIAYTWGRVAGLIFVPLQLPYIVSAGMSAMGLIVVGVAVITIQAKRQNAAGEARELDRLSEVLRDLAEALPEAGTRARRARAPRRKSGS